MQNVTKMDYMFSETKGGCSTLKTIDLSSFNTKFVRDISNMFSNCSGLKSINLKSFNATYAKTEGMFFGCKKL